jgi:hypothetical protein
MELYCQMVNLLFEKYYRVLMRARTCAAWRRSGNIFSKQKQRQWKNNAFGVVFPANFLKWELLLPFRT